MSFSTHADVGAACVATVGQPIFPCSTPTDIDFYLKHRPEAVAEHDEHDPYSSKHVKGGHEAYYLLTRIEDLTGTSHQWEKKKEDEIAKMLKGLQATQNQGDSSRATTDHVEDGDDRLASVFDQWQEKHQRRINSDSKIHDKKTKFATSLYGEYCREFLYELDTRGGRNLGSDCDRFDFFKNSTHSIEFVRDGMLQKVYFQKPAAHETISKTVRSELLLSLDHKSQQDKLRSFVGQFENIRVALEYQARLRSNPVTSLIAEGTGPYWKGASLVVTYIINVLMLIAYTAPDSNTDPVPKSPQWFDTTIWFLGTIHVMLSGVIAGEYLVNNLAFPPSATTVYHFLFVSGRLALASDHYPPPSLVCVPVAC